MSGNDSRGLERRATKGSVRGVVTGRFPVTTRLKIILFKQTDKILKNIHEKTQTGVKEPTYKNFK